MDRSAPRDVFVGLLRYNVSPGAIDTSANRPRGIIENPVETRVRGFIRAIPALVTFYFIIPSFCRMPPSRIRMFSHFFEANASSSFASKSNIFFPVPYKFVGAWWSVPTPMHRWPNTIALYHVGNVKVLLYQRDVSHHDHIYLMEVGHYLPFSSCFTAK